MAPSLIKDVSNMNTTSIGFEDQIWTVANILRGNMEASGCKN